MNKPLSLQMWSLRDDQKQDFAATVRQVKAIGFDGIELAGFGNLDAASAKAAVDEAGLQVSGLHVSLQQLRTDPFAVIQDALLFKTKNVICPWLPATYYPSRSACEVIGEELGRAGAILRSYGLQLHFHNHAPELQVLEGRTVFEWILGAASPRDLMAEVDVYWVKIGGECPAGFIRRLGTRCNLVHLKDENEIGLGPVDFPAVFAELDRMPWIEWHVIEQERYNHAPLESIRLSFEQLKCWGRA
jgi:sugar phosphate isomerase/epimerase